MIREGALYDCAACRASGKQAERYCPDLGVADPSGGWEHDGVFQPFCPCSTIRREAIDVIAEAVHVRNFKCLPAAGGLDDQDNRTLELLSVAISGMRTDLDG